MGMGFAPTWLRQVSPLLRMTTLTCCVPQMSLASEDWREAWRPSPRYPGAFSGQRQGWKTLEDPLVVHCFCIYSRIVHCWKISLV